MKTTFLICLINSAIICSAQVYKGKDLYDNEFWVKIKNDSANIFQLKDSKFINGHWKEVDSIVPIQYVSKKENKPGVYKMKKYFYLVLPRRNKGKRIKLQLEKSNDYIRNIKNLYTAKLQEKIYHISDSLCPNSEALKLESYHSHGAIHTLISNGSYEYINYQADSLTHLIDSLSKPEITKFYSELKNIENLTEARLKEILSTTNYSHYSGEYLLFKLADTRPKILINYLNSAPLNEKDILNNIRWSTFNREINQRIRKVKSKSKAKRKILKQVRVRNAINISAGTLYMGIITGEIVGIIFLVRWLT